MYWYMYSISLCSGHLTTSLHVCIESSQEYANLAKTEEVHAAYERVYSHPLPQPARAHAHMDGSRRAAPEVNDR